MTRRDLLTKLAWLPLMGPALMKLAQPATRESALHFLLRSGVERAIPSRHTFDLVRSQLFRERVNGFRFVWYKEAIENPEKIRVTGGFLGYWERIGGRDHNAVVAWVDAWGVHLTPSLKMTESQWWMTARNISAKRIPLSDFDVTAASRFARAAR